MLDDSVPQTIATSINIPKIAMAVITNARANILTAFIISELGDGLCRAAAITNITARIDKKIKKNILFFNIKLIDPIFYKRNNQHQIKRNSEGNFNWYGC